MSFKYKDLYLTVLKYGWHIEVVMGCLSWCNGEHYEHLCEDEWYARWVVK
jgi:hypothetical protein